MLPNDEPAATDAAAQAYLTTVSTIFSSGNCAAQLAAAKERVRVTIPLKEARAARIT